MIGFGLFMIFLGYRTFVSAMHEKYVLLAAWSAGLGIGAVVFGLMCLVCGGSCCESF